MYPIALASSFSFVVVVVVQKLWHFVISLLLLNYLKLEYVFTFQRAIHTIKEDSSKCIFFRIMPLFLLEYFILFHTPNIRALAPACCALVTLEYFVPLQRQIPPSLMPRLFCREWECKLKRRLKNQLIQDVNRDIYSILSQTSHVF